jgi:hypothetical protein
VPLRALLVGQEEDKMEQSGGRNDTILLQNANALFLLVTMQQINITRMMQKISLLP